jgi:hypothetical protein
MSMMNILRDLVENFVATVVMLVLGILGLFITVFVISRGAQQAFYIPEGYFEVLPATILVKSTIPSGLMK